MKKRLRFTIATILIILVGCGNQTIFPSSDVTAEVETTEENIEKQLQVIIDNYEWGFKHYNGVYHYYAITDLDQNGRLELISTIIQGSGQYTDSYYYEVNEALDGLNELKLADKKLESGADIVADSIPAYYDIENNIYYYIFDDVIKSGIKFCDGNKRAIALKNGSLSEQILAYKTTWYGENSSFEDADGNEISESGYHAIANTVFPDFIKKEVCFSWIDWDVLDLDTLNDNILKDILRKSYHEFFVY